MVVSLNSRLESNKEEEEYLALGVLVARVLFVQRLRLARLPCSPRSADAEREREGERERGGGRGGARERARERERERERQTDLREREREFFIDNLLVRIHFIIEMIW